jgi:hypothetical protein
MDLHRPVKGRVRRARIHRRRNAVDASSPLGPRIAAPKILNAFRVDQVLHEAEGFALLDLAANPCRHPLAELHFPSGLPHLALDLTDGNQCGQ